MRTTAVGLGVALGAALLAGCVSPPAGPAIDVQPFAGVRHGGGDLAAGYYQLGRYYEGAGRPDLAADAYRKALAQDRGFAEAHNALGVIYAGEQRLDAAKAEFDAALALSPRSAHVHNNLGWALYLQGDIAAAIASFERSAALDPSNPRTWNNLGLARAKLGEPSKAQEAFARAVDAPKDVLARSGPAQTGEGAAKKTAAPALVAVAPNVYEIKWPAASEDVAPAVAAATTLPAPRTYRLEVSNGNGVNGMAKRVGDLLAAAGEPAARLTNHKPFGQAVTEIQYRGGHGAAAAALRERIPGSPATVASASLRFDVDVRLLLGRDLRGDVALVEPAKRVATADRAPATSN